MAISRRDFLKSTAALTSIASFLGCRAAAAKPVRKKPNIILIMADDISAKEFPTYNNPKPTYGDGPCTTPVFKKIKNDGVQFAIAWATPLCHPSRGMIMTGRYAHRTQWWSNGFSPTEGEKNHALYESHLTLGQITKRRLCHPVRRQVAIGRHTGWLRLR